MGLGLLAMAVAGLIMFEQRWIKIVSGFILVSTAFVFAIDALVGEWCWEKLIKIVILVAVLSLVAWYVYRVHHMFDSKDT